MGKPPALPVDSQSLTVTGKLGILAILNRSKFKNRRLPMYEEQSLSHTRWECKYHIICIPKYRKKAIFADCENIWEKYFENWQSRKSAQ